MRRPLVTVQDLIEEAKVRALWWAICIFGICYFLSHTSKSMWTNAPISIIIFVALCYLSKVVELRWKVQPVQKETYLPYMNRTQMPVNGPSLSASLPKSIWKRKINSPPVEAAVHDFIDKVLQDFMTDLWYSTITPDKEAPELIKALILDAIGEISGRIREINLVELLTRDVVELISNHLNLFRHNQSIIGVEVMGTLSFEERDERLKHHLMISKELHPALVSPECEYKVLQRLFGGILSIILEPREAQCPLVLCFARELLTCLVMQPVMNLASPGYINELIEYLATNANNGSSTQATSSTTSHDHSDLQKNVQKHEIGTTQSTFSGYLGDMVLPVKNRLSLSGIPQSVPLEDSRNTVCPKPADWARVLEAATERRTQVLAPENLENMWTKGRNYKKKTAKLAKPITTAGTVKMASEVVDNYVQSGTGMELATNSHHCAASSEDKYLDISNYGSIPNTQLSANAITVNPSKGSKPLIGGGHPTDNGKFYSNESSNRFHIKRSSSTSDIKYQNNVDAASTGEANVTANYTELYDCNVNKDKEEHNARESPGHISLSECSLYLPKLRCRVVGAYFEKVGSNSFAVYSIAVSDAQNKTWFVKRRYRNFERLHRQLKEIPNYTLHLPPKRFLSSSIDDRFVHQRCILLDKYLQDLLSIANIAEQHEVWDFLSASSNNYSFGKSTSVMKTLAVNVDDAMDDIFRQFKGVSDGFRRKVVGSSSLPNEASALKTENTMFITWNEEYSNKHRVSYDNLGTSHSLSDEEPHDDRDPVASSSGWHSDNELNSKDFPPRVIKQRSESGSLVGHRSALSNKLDFSTAVTTCSLATVKFPEDLNEIPPEWAPPKVSIPLLNLVDNIFQLKRRGWLRRQVFWISKQILQLMMEDAIDDWLFSQIHLLRRDDVVAYGIRWVQDVLWPNGTFFTKLGADSEKVNSNRNIMDLAPNISWAASDKVPGPSSFEVQLEAARRASNVKKILLDGAPTTLVSLIGNKQYKKCAKDIYYFLESTVCIKQLAYGLLELLLLSLFPELHDLIVDVHQNTPSI